MHKMGLFRVTSIVNNLSHEGENYDGIEMKWFVVYRDSSNVTYDQVIINYTKNLDNSYRISENNLYELFTEKEANALKKYLVRAHKQECGIKKADLLLEVYTLGYGNKALENREDYYRLDNEDGYDLPFVVWGYYDLSYGKDVSGLTHEMRLIERVLDKLGVSITDKDKKALIEDLKDEGLIVERGIEKERIQGAKYSMGASVESTMNSEEKHKRITFNSISVILVMLFSLLVFNNGREFTKIVSNFNPKTVYGKSSKEADSEVTKDIEKVSAKEIVEERIVKMQSNRTEGEKKTIQQISSQKKHLIVISQMANVRGGPAIDFPIWSVAKKGEVIEKLDDKQEKWMKIKTPDGEVGWISKELLGETAE